MKKAIFGLLDFPGPWTIGFLRKTRFRDIFTFRVFGLFGPSPLTAGKIYKKIMALKLFLAIEKKTSPPLARGGRGGGPPIPGAARN